MRVSVWQAGLDVVQRDFRLGEWVVRPQRDCIDSRDETIHVTPKSMGVLECLAGAEGEVVSRNDILDTVWPGAEVTDDVLTHSVTELRKAFGDTAHDSHVIETIPKKGLRLLPEISWIEGPDCDSQAPGPSARSGLRLGLLIALVIVIGALSSFYIGSREDISQLSARPGEKSIAVLPFADLSEAQDHQHLAQGLSEELALHLSWLQGLSVVGPRAGLNLARNHDPRTALGKLSTDFVLDGSIRRTGENLRIAAQLVDSHDGVQIWTHALDQPFSGFPAMQEEIVWAYAQALGFVLDVGQDPALAGTANPDAILEVIRGSEHVDLMPEGMARARRHYVRATAIDPDYGLAWQQVAMAYNAPVFGYDPKAEIEHRRLAQQAIARALELQPDFVDTLLVATEVHARARNWSEARRYYDRAIAMGALRDEDVYSIVKKMHVHWGMLYGHGYVKDQIALLEKVHRLRPLTGNYAAFLPQAYHAAGRYDEALQEAERAYEEPAARAIVSPTALGIGLSMNDSAVIELWLKRTNEAHPSEIKFHSVMRDSLGDRRSALAELRAAYENGPEYDYWVVLWARYYSDDELALRAMRRSPDRYYFWTPLLAPLRKTEAFKELVSDMGLVDYWREYGWNDYCQPISAADFQCR